MEITEITDMKHPLYAEFKELYQDSFPIFEQRTESRQQEAFSDKRYRLTAYLENRIFAGFIACWELETCIYIEHLAINRKLRNQGYGKRMLGDFISRATRPVLLEIDPITDSVSEARLHFYLRCGFHTNPYPHVHPPYRQGYAGHPLIILSTGGTVTENEYRQFNRDLTEIVMKADARL